MSKERLKGGITVKATGIVRRIDDLGRVVIPKEIRRTLRIHEGEAMEIFIGAEGDICLKKFSPIVELSKYAKELAEAMSQTTGHLICISDQEQIVTAAGQGQRDYLEEAISSELEEIIEERELRTFVDNKKDGIEVLRTRESMVESLIVQPIISAGDAIGAVIIIGIKQPVEESDIKGAQIVAGFLGKQMEG